MHAKESNLRLRASRSFQIQDDDDDDDNIPFIIYYYRRSILHSRFIFSDIHIITNV